MVTTKKKALIKGLQAILLDNTGRFSADERIEAAHHLIEDGTREEVVETFMKQIGAARAEDEAINKTIISILHAGYQNWMESKSKKIRQTRLFWVKDGKLYPTVEVDE